MQTADHSTTREAAPARIGRYLPAIARRWCAACASRLRAFATAQNGVAAIEFAYLMPIMLAIWVGTTLASEAVNANRKAVSLAYSIGDMLSQMRTITQENLDDIFRVSTNILWPFQSSATSIRLTSYKINDKGQVYVLWSAIPTDKILSVDYPKIKECTKVPDFSNNLILINSEIIMIEVQVTYTASIGAALASQFYSDSFINGTSSIKSSSYTRFRLPLVVNSLANKCKEDPYL